MKCRVCATEIPEGKRCCPKCGRVITSTAKKTEDEAKNNQSTLSDRTMVYRPATSKSSQQSDKTIKINDIFSSDPNAPTYSDPHTYDRATADVLEYDRMFMKRADKENYDDGEDMKFFEPKKTNEQHNFTVTSEYDNDYDETSDIFDSKNDTMESRGAVIRDKKRAKPHINFNMKYLMLAIAVIAGLIVIVFGTYQLCKQFGIINDDEKYSNISGENAETTTKKKNENDTDDDNSYTAQTGVYTVYSDQNNIFVYKSISDQRIIATIPNKTIINVSEIKNDFCKTTYNGYTGWVKIDELKFTPNEKPIQQETEPASNDETTTQEQTTGTYTVTLNGTSNTLNVRSIGSTDGEVITTLSDGAQVNVEEIKNGWGKIFINEVEGWVYMEYLK